MRGKRKSSAIANFQIPNHNMHRQICTFQRSHSMQIKLMLTIQSIVRLEITKLNSAFHADAHPTILKSSQLYEQ